MPRIPLTPAGDGQPGQVLVPGGIPTPRSTPTRKTSTRRTSTRRSSTRRSSTRKSRKASAAKPRATHPRAARAHAASVPATTRAPLPAGSDPWHAAGHAGVGAAPLRELAANGTGLGDVLLELVGAEHGNLRAALTAWQREQDRLSNRAWRRPGGLARPAGL